MKSLKKNSIHAVTNQLGHTFWVRIVKHEPTIDLCIAKVCQITEPPTPKEWARAPYAICVVTDIQAVILAGHNFDRLGQTFGTPLTPYRVLDYLLEELTRARTTFTEVVYEGDYSTYPPINIGKGYELYKMAREVAAIGIARAAGTEEL